MQRSGTNTDAAATTLDGAYCIQFFKRDFDEPPGRSRHLFNLMILSYRDKRTQDFASGKAVKALSGFKRSAEGGPTSTSDALPGQSRAVQASHFGSGTGVAGFS